jgi:Pregnancy-associated plasma protein-A
MKIATMFLNALSLLHILAVVVVSGHNHNHNHHPHDHDHTGDGIITECGTEPPSKVQAALDIARGDLFKNKKHGRSRRAQAESCQDLCKQCIEIEVYVHFMQFAGQDFGLDFDFIPHPTSSVERLLLYFEWGCDVSDFVPDDFTSIEYMRERVDDQIAILNKYYANTPFFFTQMERDSQASVTTNTDWARYAFDEWEGNMTQTLYRGDLRTLNIYFGYTVDSREDVDAGYTTFAFTIQPSFQYSTGIYQYVTDFRCLTVFLAAAQAQAQLTFCFQLNSRYDILPSGGYSRKDLGMTTIHEVGHWLGLYHTFQGAGTDPCSPSNLGDRIEDTPTQARPTQDMFNDCTIFLGSDPAPLP